MTARKKNISVFIASAHDDREFANSMRRDFAKLGVMSRNGAPTRSGADFAPLKSQIEKSDVFVFIIPAHEGAGKWALAELGAAKALGKEIFAVSPDRTRFRNGDLLKSLFSRQILDASDLPGGDVAERIMQSAELAHAA